MYALSMFILLRGGARKVPTLRWALLVMSTILFLLCTCYVGASLQQLLDAFVYAPAGIPDYSTTYWLDLALTPRIIKNMLYSTLALVQDLIQIWRLYVVFMYDWRVVVFPIMLAAGCVGSAYAGNAISALPNHGLYDPVVRLIIAACVFESTLNIIVTTAIVARIWFMGRRVPCLTGTSTTRFAFLVYTVIESGFICAVCGAVVLALFLSDSLAALTAFDVIAQVAVLAPVLIIVQVGLRDRYRSRHGDPSRMMPPALVGDEIIFRGSAPREQDSGVLQDLPLHTMPSRSPNAAHDVQA
ncbi:hypothetical protein V8E55_005967 [Tylopilus felleus]